MGAFLGKEAQRRDVSTISPAAAASTARADTPPVYAQNQYQRFAEAGIYISASGSCYNRQLPTCTSMDGIKEALVQATIALKQKSGGNVVMTGGTEVGHAPGPISHESGDKIDLRLDSTLGKYIQSKWKFNRIREDGASEYIESHGNLCAFESNHLDCTFTCGLID